MYNFELEKRTNVPKSGEYKLWRDLVEIIVMGKYVCMPETETLNQIHRLKLFWDTHLCSDISQPITSEISILKTQTSIQKNVEI